MNMIAFRHQRGMQLKYFGCQSAKFVNKQSFSSKNEMVTFDKIFSQENKDKCKEHLLNVKPARSSPWAVTKEMEQAAVLIPMCTINGEPSILFTKRSNKLNNYRGQVSFPGGKEDQSDTSKIHTAIREAEEEIGLNPDQVDTWGRLLPVPGKDYKTAVTPVLAFCGELDLSKLVMNEHEVEAVFSRSIESLCHQDYNGYTSFRGKTFYTLPVFIGGQHRIWGLTAVVLHMTLNLLVPGLYSSKLNSR